MLARRTLYQGDISLALWWGFVKAELTYILGDWWGRGGGLERAWNERNVEAIHTQQNITLQRRAETSCQGERDLKEKQYIHFLFLDEINKFVLMLLGMPWQLSKHDDAGAGRAGC